MNNRGRLLTALLGAGFTAFFLWSVLFETILPLIERGDTASLARNAIGIPLLVGGTGAFVWGAWLLLRAIFDPEERSPRVARWLVAGILLVAFGGYLTQ